MPSQITFIVVNFFTKQLIADLIQSIFQCGEKVNLEVIVVDNTLEKQSCFKSEIENVKVHYTDKNIGFGSACNIGAKLATSQNLVFINPDSIFFHPDSIRFLAESFDSFTNETIFGGKILNEQRKPVCNTFTFSNFIQVYYQNSFRRALGISLPFVTNQHSAFKADRCIEVDWISGAFLCIKKEFFLKLGGFDEQIFMYEEDAEFCYRAREQNGKVVFIPKIEIVHYGGLASKVNNDLLSFIGFKSALYFYQKRYYGFKSWLLKQLIYFTWKMIYFQSIIFALISPSFFAPKKRFWQNLVGFSKKFDKITAQEIINSL